MIGFRDMDLKKEVINRIEIPRSISKKEADMILESEHEITVRNEAITARL